MRRTVRLLGAIVALTMSCLLLYGENAQAAFYGLPRALKNQLTRLTFDIPSLAPMAFTRFCLQYPQDCEVRRMMAYRRGVVLIKERWAELAAINREVNRAIIPQRNDLGVAGEEWLVSPQAGDCNDYAVTKRHELLARGWPSRSLILAEVVIASGEHHLVLVVRTRDGDFVLDNLNAHIRTVAQTRYRWVRAQLPKNPNFWARVRVAPMGLRTAALD
jgi:predicted transglutaminase-like cysteine proteinase